MSKSSKFYNLTAFKSLAVLLVLLIILTQLTQLLVTYLESQEFRERYSEIETGMRESTVLTLLGSADDRSSELNLGQGEGFEEVQERAVRSGATYYLMWYNEADVVYVIGFDEEAIVAIVEVAGS
jgi:hypothetical protein|tara:strand:- start:433 stop:807 length:375 start_codon:yes stop_codon:yes gene_type:complete